MLKALRAITSRAKKPPSDGPGGCITWQETALTEGQSGKLYYNQLTTQTRGLAKG